MASSNSMTFYGYLTLRFYRVHEVCLYWSQVTSSSADESVRPSFFLFPGLHVSYYRNTLVTTCISEIATTYHLLSRRWESAELGCGKKQADRRTTGRLLRYVFSNLETGIFSLWLLGRDDQTLGCTTHLSHPLSHASKGYFFTVNNY